MPRKSKSSKKYTTIAKVKKLKSKSSKRSVKRSNKSSTKKSKSKSKKPGAWNAHMMSVYREMKKKNPDTKLGDAMKAAKKTYKKK
uniref:Uncharacterized protein n=1 Tax=viral metagenome TaxID=1070528 RepID=A0A6C0C5K8_9ZZZZ